VIYNITFNKACRSEI